MFSNVLQKLRKDARLTQDQIADVLGIPKRTYGSWERNERQPDFEMLGKIADYFNVTTDYLLGRVPMEIEVIHGDPPPLAEDEVEIVIEPDQEAPSPQELERLILQALKSQIPSIVDQELKKRGL